jgi:hypothetical protein
MATPMQNIHNFKDIIGGKLKGKSDLYGVWVHMHET